MHGPRRTSSIGATTSLPKPANAAPSMSSNESLAEHAHDMRRLLSHATSADECRLIVDIFLARAGLRRDSAEASDPSSPPSPTYSQLGSPSLPDATLRSSLVEILLEGDRHNPSVDGPSNNIEIADQQTSTQSTLSAPHVTATTSSN